MFLLRALKTCKNSSAIFKPTAFRSFQTSANRLQKDCKCEDSKLADDIVHVFFKDRNGTVKEVIGKVGDNLMDLGRQHGIDIEGACEGSCACSTCHVFVKDDFFNELPDATDEENDMLDQAPFLKPNSRLSCQIILTKDLDGIEVELPPATRNFYVDGHKPVPH